MDGSQRQEKPLPVAEGLPPGCPPQPPVKQHGQFPVIAYGQPPDTWNQTTSQLSYTYKLWRHLQLNFKPHATYEQ